MIFLIKLNLVALAVPSSINHPRDSGSVPLGFYVENTATGETSQAGGGGGGEEEAGGQKEQRDKKEKPLEVAFLENAPISI